MAKSTSMSFRVTEQNGQRIKRFVEETGLTRSEYLRKVALQELSDENPAALRHHLRQLVFALRDIHREEATDSGHVSPSLGETLKEVQDLLDQLKQKNEGGGNAQDPG